MSDLTSKNKALMSRIYKEMWNGGSPALALEIFAQPEGMERFVCRFLLSFPDLQHTIEEMIEEGDQWRCVSLHKGLTRVNGWTSHQQANPSITPV